MSVGVYRQRKIKQMKTQLKMLPLDGTEHLAYLEAVLSEPSLNPQDIVKLRDRPDVLHHIKGVYSVLLHNIACLIEKNANKHLPPEKFIPFPKGRIKLLNSEDYTFSFTELSDYGESSSTFSQLYTSLGITNQPLTLDGISKAVRFSPASDKKVSTLIFPSTRPLYVRTLGFNGNFKNEPLRTDFPLLIEQVFLLSNLRAFLKDPLSINYTPPEFRKKAPIPNFSHPYNYTSWVKENVILTNEALEAFYRIDLMLQPEVHEFSFDIERAEDYKVPKNDSRIVERSLSVPGSIVSTEEGTRPRELPLSSLTFVNTFNKRIIKKELLINLGQKNTRKSIKVTYKWVFGQAPVGNRFKSQQLTSLQQCTNYSFTVVFFASPAPAPS